MLDPPAFDQNVHKIISVTYFHKTDAARLLRLIIKMTHVLDRACDEYS